jgi:hypothetical protein
MSNTVEIYEFSRAFDNVQYSDVYGRWVSGGYAPEKINRSNQSVPPELRKAVTSDYFTLNDSYPPLEGEVALIGYELEKYSLLAVANKQIDDGGRPTIGYRYFWLEQQEGDQELDGVGTLLFWWHAQMAQPPQFEMAQALSHAVPESVTFANDLRTRTRFTEEFESEIENLVTDQLIPQIKVVNPLDLDYIQCHFLAYSLAMKTQRSLAWAWNVRRLVQPESFLSIYAATEREKPAVPRIEIAIHYASRNQPVEEKDSYQTVSIETSLKDIESRFSASSNLNHTGKLDEILQYLSNPCPIKIDHKLYENSQIYSALVSLFVADRADTWIEKLIALSDLENHEVCKGFELHHQIIEAVYGKILRSPEAYKNLRLILHENISNFLLKVLRATEKKQVEKLSDLLEVLGNCWERPFQEYIRVLERSLSISTQSNAEQAENKDTSAIVDPFYNEVLELIQERKRKLQNREKFANHKKFRVLAQFFKKKNSIALSSMFRYLNSDEVIKDAPQWLSLLLLPQPLPAEPIMQSNWLRQVLSWRPRSRS